MTKRIYYEQPYLAHLDTVVIECVERSDGMFEVLTRETIVFPEGGGQPSDIGAMNNAKIIGARDEVENIWHITTERFSSGDFVHIAIDFTRRFDHSQQHTGEHIVSGLAHKLFGAKNVGFHMGEDYITIDFDTMLTPIQLNELESEVNAAIVRDIPVRSTIVDICGLESIPLRKRSDGIEGDIRIVSIDGIDACTCCGTHTETTGGVGIVKITDSMKHRSGIRIWAVCGDRALTDYRSKHDALIRLGRHFSTNWQNVENLLIAQTQELSNARFEIKRQYLKYCELRAKELCFQTQEGVIVAIEQGASMEEIKLLADRVIQNSEVIAVILGIKGDVTSYCLMRSSNIPISMRTLCSKLNELLGGKGGGRDDIAQGSAHHSAELNYDCIRSAVLAAIPKD